MRTYWSHSKFAKWLTHTLGGMPQPSAETSNGWVLWEKAARARAPFAHWLVHTGLSNAQRFLTYPWTKLTDCKYYIRNRYITKSHAIVTSLRRGQYHSVDELILHGLFTLLVDFIEIEKAHMHVAWGDEHAKAQYEYPWWRRWNLLRWQEWRMPIAGIAYLEWEAALVWKKDEWVDNESPMIGQPTGQASAAQEQLVLYNWWINVRPNRPDPYDASGWTAHCDAKYRKDDILVLLDGVEDEPAKTTKALDSLHDLEKQYDDEDEEMMTRLMKIRQHLWT